MIWLNRYIQYSGLIYSEWGREIFSPSMGALQKLIEKHCPSAKSLNFLMNKTSSCSQQSSLCMRFYVGETLSCSTALASTSYISRKDNSVPTYYFVQFFSRLSSRLNSLPRYYFTWLLLHLRYTSDKIFFQRGCVCQLQQKLTLCITLHPNIQVGVLFTQKDFCIQRLPIMKPAKF